MTGSDTVYFIGQSFGPTYFTSDGVFSSPGTRGSSVNCFDQKPRIAVDSLSSNRLVAGDRCTGTLSLQYSEDGANNYSSPKIAPDGTAVNGEYDVSFVGGTAIWAGNGGDIFTTNDGRTAYAQKADGVNAGRDWRAVSAYSAANAAIGGVGGALVVSSQANTIPDLIAPAGSINQPGKVTAGVPTRFTATVADNAGGSGIDPNSFQWTATGIPAAAGNPATITFPAAGSVTLNVAFKDLAGNAGQATISFDVVAGARTTPGGKSSGTIKGTSVTLQGPKACVRPGVPFTATMSMKRAKRKGAVVVKLSSVDFSIDGVKKKTDRKAPFVQRLTVAAAAPGTLHKLRARGTIKVRRGRPAKKSLTVTFRVCS